MGRVGETVNGRKVVDMYGDQVQAAPLRVTIGARDMTRSNMSYTDYVCGLDFHVNLKSSTFSPAISHRWAWQELTSTGTGKGWSQT